MKLPAFTTFPVLLAALVTAASAQEHQHDHSSTCAAPGVVQTSCTTEEFLLDRLAHDGVGPAMAALDSIAARDPDIRRMGHAYAHAIGLAAFSDPETVGEAFSACTPIFQSGCYHGVIQSYFSDRAGAGEPLTAALLERLCEGPRSDSSSHWELFQCVHGVGHGLMLASGNHVPNALESCDLFASPWERESCYSAVFMENVVAATSTPDDVGRPQGHSHDHAAMPADHSMVMTEPWPALKKDDPLYPCTVLPTKYLNACYQMQTSAILNQNGLDVRDAADACAGAPADFLSTCYQSLGRDISGITVQNNQRAVSLCRQVPPDYRPFCHLGYAKNLVDVTADLRPGMAFCAELVDVRSKEICYIGMGEEVWVLHQEEPARVAECARAEEAYVSQCRFGAGLSD